jgi:hypothetical protein
MNLKMHKLTTLLIIIVLIFFLIGCNYSDNENNLKEYFSEEDLVSYSIAESNPKTTLEDFTFELLEFYDFTKEFFLVWDDYVEDTSLLLEKFNNENTTFKEKIMYSRLLRQKYENFHYNLEQIVPPSNAEDVHRLALGALSKRILFFEEFEKETDIDILKNIEHEAYLYESLFWDELDKIYAYFEKTAVHLGISKNYILSL